MGREITIIAPRGRRAKMAKLSDITLVSLRDKWNDEIGWFKPLKMDLDVCGNTTIEGAELHMISPSDEALRYTCYDAFYASTKRQPRIVNVIFNDPATIVFWSDNTKTVVKCQDDDIYDPEKGLAMAIAKKYFGNKGNYCNEFKKWLPKSEPKEAYYATATIDDMKELTTDAIADVAKALKKFCDTSIIKEQ